MIKYDLNRSFVEQYIEYHNLTKKQYAKLCGIHVSTLNRIIKCKGVKYSTLDKLYFADEIDYKLLRNEK